jgi:MOSC domain-containing protein YiiM
LVPGAQGQLAALARLGTSCAVEIPLADADPFAAIATAADRLVEAWDQGIRPGTDERQAFLADILEGFHTAGRALRAAGVGPATAVGRVVQLNVSGGGVPKRPVPEVTVDVGGVVGDRQATRRHHGRPWQALCLWSAEVIDRFAADGHPITYGAAGENVTIGGIDWATVRPGVVVRIGNAVAETSAWALPCRHNGRWFRNGEFGLMHHERGPVSRIYATVLEPGTVRTGDPVVLEP